MFKSARQKIYAKRQHGACLPKTPGACDDAVAEAGPAFLECSSSLAFTASKHTSQTLSNKKMLNEQTSLCHLALLAWRVCHTL
jgi:hypothetical protein